MAGDKANGVDNRSSSIHTGEFYLNTKLARREKGKQETKQLNSQTTLELCISEIKGLPCCLIQGKRLDAILYPTKPQHLDFINNTS
ncbi:hypothetical protein HanHA89_Chr02g0069041 [Helianthus annuus]|nr:hypothetical protein HanHA89_Chr02g0069041 [Helianthus annuus]